MKYFLNLALFMAIFLGQTALFAQTTTGDVRGFVYDKETGEPIIFTNVYMEGTGYGASTDVNGFYSINKVPAGDYVLLCTYVGYDTTRINIQIKAGEIANQKIFTR